MVSVDNKIKICDFGLAREQHNTIRDDPLHGTAPYMAPEIISSTQCKYSAKTDIYALGILIWEVMARKKPF